MNDNNRGKQPLKLDLAVLDKIRNDTRSEESASGFFKGKSGIIHLIHKGRQYVACVRPSPERGFRGVITGCNRMVEFYGEDEDTLLDEFKKSLEAYLGDRQ